MTAPPPSNTERSTPGNPLLDGMHAARRPTGPVIALLVLLAAFVVGQLLVAVPFYLFVFGPGGPREGTPAWQLFFTVGLFGGTLLLLYLWVRLKEGRPFAGVGFRSRPGGIVLGAVAGFVMIGVVVLAGVASGQASVTGAPVTTGLAGVVLLGLAGFAVQGSTEEILTRGFLLQAVAGRWGLVAAVAVQAVVFSLLHGANPGGFAVLPLVNLVLVALFLAGWALLEGGLWGVCAWHAVWNWAQGNVWGLTVSGIPLDATVLRTSPSAGSSSLVTGGEFGPEGGLVTTAVLLAGIGFLLLLHRRRTTEPAAVRQARRSAR